MKIPVWLLTIFSIAMVGLEGWTMQTSVDTAKQVAVLQNKVENLEQIIHEKIH